MSQSSASSDHPSFEQLKAEFQKTEAFIDGIEVDENDQNSYYDAIDALDDCICFQLFEHWMERMPSNTEADCDLACEMKERLDRLIRRRDSKLREIGYCPD